MSILQCNLAPGHSHRTKMPQATGFISGSTKGRPLSAHMNAHAGRRRLETRRRRSSMKAIYPRIAQEHEPMRPRAYPHSPHAGLERWGLFRSSGNFHERQPLIRFRPKFDHHGSMNRLLIFPAPAGGWCTTHVGTPKRGSTHACSTNHNASTAININAFSMSALQPAAQHHPRSVQTSHDVGL
jgi:hypothetical protein